MLTVEDVNTIIRKYGVESFYYEFDTTCLPFDDDEEFTDYECEFFTVSKRLNSQGEYQWYFRLKNNYYMSQAYLLNLKSNTYSLSTSKNHCTVWFTSDFILCLEMSVLEEGADRKLNWECLDELPQAIPLNRVGEKVTLRWRILGNNTPQPTQHALSIGVNKVLSRTGVEYHYSLIRLQKTQFEYTCNQTLTCGKVNKVLLGTSEDYKPGGALIQDNTPTITVEYKNQIIPVTWSETDNDYIFYLDLTQDYNPGKLNLNILVETNDVINESIDSITLLKEIETVTSFDRLKEEILAGTGLIHIGDNITFTSDLILNYDAKLLGNQHTLEMGGYKIQLSEDKTLILNDLTLNEGNPAIIQENNTTLELNRCTFTGNTSEDYNQLGSCIYCNTNIENLTITDDYITNINDCLFQDNQSTIFHGGQLSINGSKFILSDSNFAEASNPAFLYQTDGEANINNSSFIIIQDGNEWCSDEENIGYAQTILVCGENAIVNGEDHSTLQKQNSLPFYDTHNNKTYLYAKYYYPRLEGCVVTSPLSGFEDKNCTYAVSGVDWIFKQNSQVTLPTEANNNQPNWEEW